MDILQINIIWLIEKVKEVEILQMIICGDKEVIAEVILKEDFEKYFEGSK